jgi:divalent metal cation (Fe/Co/Zn/Cd) transporter
LSDFVTLATLRVSRLPPDADHPYGHGRFEALGALLIAGLLCTTAVAFGNHAYEGLLAAVAQTAAQATAAAAGAAGAAAATAADASGSSGGGWARLGSGQLRGHALAAAAAVVSIVSKEALFVATKKVGERTNSPVLVANAWHHRSDALSSVQKKLRSLCCFFSDLFEKSYLQLAARVLGAKSLAFGVWQALPFLCLQSSCFSHNLSTRPLRYLIA